MFTSLSQSKLFQKFLTTLTPYYFSYQRKSKASIKLWSLSSVMHALANSTEKFTYTFFIQIKAGLNKLCPILCSHHLPAKERKCFSPFQWKPPYQLSLDRISVDLDRVQCNSMLLHFWCGIRISCTQTYLNAGWTLTIPFQNTINFEWKLSCGSWACVMCWVSCNTFTLYTITIWYIIWNPAKTHLRNKLSYKWFLKNLFSIIIKSPLYIH